MGGKAMLYAGYGLALVLGVAALITGITTGKGVVAGAGAGWLISSVILIARKQTASVTGSDDTIFAMFDVKPPWLWGVVVGLLVVGGVVGYLIKP
jgi:hypothetical protein